jgi:hydroxymethylpyrimidine/phosphomethylpyrimidine kinase
MAAMRVALAVGGLDPSGGAGIVADARAIQAAGAWPLVVSAVSTVQTQRGLRRVRPVDKRWVRLQIDALAADTSIRVLKTGALGDAAGIVCRAALRHRIRHVVVDPVLRPSEGRGVLTNRRGLSSLLSIATLMTPNVLEAEQLLGGSIDTVAQAREAAVALRELGPRAVLLKGGHLPGIYVTDWFADEATVRKVARRRLAVGEVHGTGCALASLIAGRLACRRSRAKLDSDELTDIVRWGTKRLNRWLRRTKRIGPGMALLGG